MVKDRDAMMKCPGCGRSVADNEYFCAGCGEALFPEWSSSKVEPHVEHLSHPPLGQAASMRADGSPAANVQESGPGRKLMHGAVPIGPAVRPTLRERIPWGPIAAVVVVVVIVAVALSLYFVLRSPGIKVSPPHGWIEVPAAQKDAEERSLKEDSPQTDLVAMYLKEDDGTRRILIYSRAARDDGEIPETGDVAEIELYIAEMEESSYDPQSGMNPYEMKMYLEDMKPVALNCGLAALYQSTYHGGDYAWEVISVRKKDRVFIMMYIKSLPDENISAEMQYFIDTISFD